MKAAAEHPLVSVIIPTYNRGWILKEALESVLAQDFCDFELIVVDDGSTDDTAEILAGCGPSVRVLTQTNRGVSAARNRGLAAARGRLVAFLDSDDIWLPGKLKEQAGFLRANPEAVVCQTQELWIRDGVRVNPKERHRKFSGTIFERCLPLCLVSPSAVMIRKCLFEVVGVFDEQLPACEDYDLWLRISCRYPIHLIDKPLIVKRGGHIDQLSRAPGLDKYRIRALEKILDSGLLSPGQHRAAARTLEQKCGVYAVGCRRRGRQDEARFYEQLAQRFTTRTGV
jgi:glycosyltransferase involved in cell wall biosynthesis